MGWGIWFVFKRVVADVNWVHEQPKLEFLLLPCGLLQLLSFWFWCGGDSRAFWGLPGLML